MNLSQWPQQCSPNLIAQAKPQKSSGCVPQDCHGNGHLTKLSIGQPDLNASQFVFEVVPEKLPRSSTLLNHAIIDCSPSLSLQDAAPFFRQLVNRGKVSPGSDAKLFTLIIYLLISVWLEKDKMRFIKTSVAVSPINLNY
jgi:hypothetical protein